MLSENLYKQIEAKTADYPVKPEDIGKKFTNRGASGAVNFTLPALADITSGWWCAFHVVAGQNFTITAPTDKLVAGNDATATSIAFTTDSEEIGNEVVVEYDGTTYLASVRLAKETFTPTIA